MDLETREEKPNEEKKENEKDVKKTYNKQCSWYNMLCFCLKDDLKKYSL